jgi:hypothetical protein
MRKNVEDVDRHASRLTLGYTWITEQPRHDGSSNICFNLYTKHYIQQENYKTSNSTNVDKKDRL